MFYVKALEDRLNGLIKAGQTYMVYATRYSERGNSTYFLLWVVNFHPSENMGAFWWWESAQIFSPFGVER